MTDNELVEIMNKLDDSNNDRSIFSDNEIDDVVMTHAIINDDSDEEEETCKIFVRNNG